MREKILVIDDDHDLARLTAIWVKSAGYEAVTAHDGETGLNAAKLHRPNLILLDIMMPNLDGFGVSRRLKDDPELACIPIIFLSAKVEETARREALTAGARYFLSKPYEGNELIAAIESILA